MMDDDDCGEEKICRTSIPYLCGKIRTYIRTYMLWVFRMHFEDIIKSRNLRKKTELAGFLRVTDFTKVSSLKKFNNTHYHRYVPDSSVKATFIEIRNMKQMRVIITYR
jgi:hypothetical protein